MFYRENGQFKTSYRSDQQIFPILQDRVFILLLIAVALFVVPFVASDYFLSGILIPFLILSLAALGLNVLVGYCGQISLGTGAFMAVGAYAAWNFGVRIPELPLIVQILLGGFFAMLVGIVFGIPSLRIRGLYLAVATLAAQFFVDWTFLRIPFFTNYSTSGSVSVPQLDFFGLPVQTPVQKYVFVLILVVIFALLIKNLVRSAIGREWMAIRDMDVAASVIGIRPMYAKLTAFAVSSFIVDKNLRMHGLLQAYSRTNRILNSIKRFGNIVCFRNLEQETNESLARFGNENARSVVLMRSFNDYYYGYTDDYGKAQQGYVDIVAELQEHFPAGDRIDSEKAKKEFIRLYGAFLKLRNILNVYDEFSERMILSERQVQDYHSMYIDLYEEFRPEKKDEVENINDDVVFEMELVKQVDVNIDYILELVRLYHEDNTKDKEIIVKIEKAVDSSVELRNKRDLILNFVHNLSPQADMDTAWREHVEREKAKQIDEVIAQENLKADLTHSFMEDSLKDGYFSEVGINFANILPPMSRFTPNNERGKKRETVAEKLKTIFNRFLGL